jgi:hypothetical protein
MTTLTFTMSHEQAFLVLVCIYVGAIYGQSVRCDRRRATEGPPVPHSSPTNPRVADSAAVARMRGSGLVIDDVRDRRSAAPCLRHGRAALLSHGCERTRCL